MAHKLSRLISGCDENSLQVLVATAEALIDIQKKDVINQQENVTNTFKDKN